MNQEVDTPPLYQAILDSFAENAEASVPAETIGMLAWERLSGAQRRDALASVLAVYVMRVHEEEHARRLDTAARDDTHSYLQDFDVAMLWDSASTPANQFEEVPANADALRNVLSELELLQHRLAMRDADETEGR